MLPPVAETLRGSLIERYLTCGKRDLQMRSGRTPWPSLVSQRDPGARPHNRHDHTTHLLERVRRWIDNYHKLKEHLEKISDINRELLRRERKKTKSKT